MLNLQVRRALFSIVVIGIFVSGAAWAEDSQKSKFEPSARVLRMKKDGGDVSGGGGDCFTPGRASSFLLDFASAPEKLVLLSQPGAKVKRRPALERIGYQRIFPLDLGPGEVLKERLKHWSSPQNDPLIEKIQRVLGQLVIRVTPYPIHLPVKILANENLCSASNTETIALYFNQQVVFNLDRLENLDLVSQGGLLLHEGLRHVQITYNRNYNTDSEIVLRQIVTHVMLFEPDEDPSFHLAAEANRFFYPLIEKNEELVQKMFAPACDPKIAPRVTDEAVLKRLFEMMKARNCVTHPEWVPKSEAAAKTGYDDACFTASGQAGIASYDRIVEAKKVLEVINNEIQNFDYPRGKLMEDYRAICAISAYTGESEDVLRERRERFSHYLNFAGAVIVHDGSRKLSQIGIGSQAQLDRLDQLARGMHLLSLANMISQSAVRRYQDQDFINSIEDLTETFGSITRQVTVDMQVDRYLSGDLKPANEKEKIEMETALDKLKAAFKMMLDANIML